ncbi:MAG: SAM-dependent DNA methyltransferase, partial [Armatimonadetes bacterium]|nr:SAM-dependent DNA methyltransferase [Armatimonadota bacterium]
YSYQSFKAEVNKLELSDSERAARLRQRYDEIQGTIDQKRRNSRLWNLANKCIYGTDANDRMARTSKMNMIMHGDGHGGVHHHDGFINVNGIFEGRFDIVLTNPPFGANVEAGDLILESVVTVGEQTRERYIGEYGVAYETSLERVQAAEGKPIASLFDLPKAKQSKVKTEILFIERCLTLLKPGGRLGIVLPEGVFNNPSLAYVREFCEDRAFISAVVSLPQETFYSSGASVKASLLFLQKFTVKEQQKYLATKEQAEAERRGAYETEINQLRIAIKKPQFKPTNFYPKGRKPTEKERVAAYEAARAANSDRIKRRDAAKKRMKELEAIIQTEARALLKKRFDYPIFLYDAEKVGITATGEADQNELYPNENLPSGLEATCLELYRQFREDPNPFFVIGPAE